MRGNVGEPLALDWARGALRVLPVGAMLAELVFDLPDGPFAPFARPHWSPDAPSLSALPAHLRHLGAEFVCLPFGVGGPLDAIAPAWRPLALERRNDPAHGLAANAVWTVEEHRADRLRLTLDYPAAHAVRRLTRVLTVSPEAPALDLELIVDVRRPTRLPLGLHPILSLDVPEASLHLKARFRRGFTYPAAVPGGAMRAAIGRDFSCLSAVPAGAGGIIDLSCLPKAAPMEDVVQLCGVEGPVEAVFAARGAVLSLDWDRALLPSCQLWISDRALTDAPWSGRYRGLGIEPIAACFDFAEPVSLADNPIAAAGTMTSLAVTPEQPVVIRYRLAARSLQGVQNVAETPPSTSRTCPVT
ncbi:hypothetical protein [Ancylobacter sp. FA202]|uniref:hypothetical protein n=1 Tax=Ancylobacter sp. FA202 TaxID=1111106 RepID=UPI000370DF98|nr:hypothetical protein [Ancylobacter sp. FA202]